MAPKKPKKRTAHATSANIPKKKAKKANDSPQTTLANATSHLQSSGNAEKQIIRWILPRVKGPNRQVDFSLQTAETFAPVLFGRPWTSLRNIEAGRLDPPPVLSPLKVRNGVRAKDHSMRNPHNDIQVDSGDPWSIGSCTTDDLCSVFYLQKGVNGAVAHAEDPPHLADHDAEITM